MVKHTCLTMSVYDHFVKFALKELSKNPPEISFKNFHIWQVAILKILENIQGKGQVQMRLLVKLKLVTLMKRTLQQRFLIYFQKFQNTCSIEHLWKAVSTIAEIMHLLRPFQIIIFIVTPRQFFKRKMRGRVNFDKIQILRLEFLLEI